MSIIHFDYRPELDAQYMKPDHIYLEYPLNEITATNNIEVTQMSVFISSKLTSQVIDMYPNLQVLMCRSAGTDHVDVAYAESKGIKVARVPGYGPHVIATHAMSLLLAGVRSTMASIAQTRAGIFSYTKNTIRDFHVMTAGIIGTGKIGQEIGNMLHVLGTKLQAYDLYPNESRAKKIGCEYCAFDNLIATSDIIILACNATEENRDLIDEGVIQAMKPGIYLINIARGSLIDEDALLRNSNKFASIGLDAIKDETSQGLAKFAEHSNIMITPHIAYLSDVTVKTIWEETYRNIN